MSYLGLINIEAAASGSSGGITASSTDTLTNKTINYNDNTITNLPGGGEFTATAKNASYTAVSGDWVVYDMSAATVGATLTLPATPALGDAVKVSLGVPHATENTYNISIGRNASSIDGGTAAEFELYNLLWTAGDTVTFRCVAASKWVTSERNIKNRFSCEVNLGTQMNNMTASSFTDVLLDTRVYDYNSSFDITTNNNYVIPITGVYMISTSIGYTGITAASLRYALRVRTSTGFRNLIYIDNYYSTNATADVIQTTGGMSHLIAGATVTLAGYTTGTNVDMRAGTQTHLKLQLLSRTLST